tara:strand:+ start:459 stop:1046 length:588 start_codon:yes stop_codon:yes gene_type:complete
MATSVQMQQMSQVERMARSTSAMIKEVQANLDNNKFMEPETASSLKKAMWGLGAAVAGGALFAAAAVGIWPILGAAVVASVVGLGVGGSLLEKVAEQRHEVRAQMSQMVQQGKELFSSMRETHTNVKNHASSEPAADSGLAMRGDFAKLQQQQQQQQELSNEMELAERLRKDQGMTTLMDLELKSAEPTKGPRLG